MIPPDHGHLLLFIAYLAYYRKFSYSAIKTYICGVKDLALCSGFKDPTRPNSSRKRHIYQKLVAGIKCASAGTKRFRKPLKRNNLLKLINAINILNYPERVCIKAALTLAFYGFLRCSDYTSNSTNRKCFLIRKDMKIINKKNGASYIKLNVRRTKTDQFTPTKIKVYGNKKLDCPVNSVCQYINSHELLDTTCVNISIHMNC